MSNIYLRGPRAATAFVSRMVKEMPKFVRPDGRRERQLGDDAS
jgi:hypothetical protein